LIDPLDLIRSLPPGSMIWGVMRERPGAGREVAFFVREESARIRRVGTLQFSTALIVEGDVALIPVLMRTGPGEEEVYESWFNYYAPGPGTDGLPLLAEQGRLPVVFVGDSGRRERALAVPNSLRDTFREMLERVSSMKPWSMEGFDRARERVYARYPTVAALWDALQAKPGGATWERSGCR